MLQLSASRASLLAGLSRSAVTDLLGGRLPGIDLVEKLAVALAIAPSQLAFGQASALMADRHRRLSTGVGQRLRIAREKAQLDKTALAAKAGVSRGMVLYIETGRSMPSVAIIEALAKALGTTPGALAYGDREPGAKNR